MGGIGNPQEVGYNSSHWQRSRWASSPGIWAQRADRQKSSSLPLLPASGQGHGGPAAPISDLGPPPYRTETMVEKLLTNWLSICLYAFLRVRGALDGTFSPCSIEGLLPVASLTCAQIPPGTSGHEGIARGGVCKGKGFASFSRAGCEAETSRRCPPLLCTAACPSPPPSCPLSLAQVASPPSQCWLILMVAGGGR